MNPAYRKTLFHIGRTMRDSPETFAVVTVCNPDGVVVSAAENAVRTETFQSHLDECGLQHFSVTGYDPDGPHEEPGFGIECDKATALSLGRQWEQEAIFWIECGRLLLVSCKNGDEIDLGAWAARVDP